MIHQQEMLLELAHYHPFLYPPLRCPQENEVGGGGIAKGVWTVTLRLQITLDHHSRVWLWHKTI